MRVLVDMNMSPRWTELLAEASIETTHWSVIGAKIAPDVEIMAHARTNGLIVLTQDLDFGAILAATQDEKPSVVQIRAEDARPSAIGRSGLHALRQMEKELERGALLIIEPDRTRLRLLPLRTRSS